MVTDTTLGQKKVIETFLAPLHELSKGRIKDYLDYSKGVYRLPEDAPFPSDFSGRRSYFFLSLLTLYIQEVASGVIIEYNGTIIIDEEKVIKGLKIDNETDLELAQKNADTISETLKKPGGNTLLIAMIMSHKKMKEFESGNLFHEIIARAIESAKKEKRTLH